MSESTSEPPSHSRDAAADASSQSRLHAARTWMVSRGRSMAGAWFWAPLSAFAITRLIVFAVAFLAEVAIPGREGDGFWHAYPSNLFIDVWARFDSGFYLSIVRNGYSYSTTNMASAAFFPLYALLVDLVNIVVRNPVLSGMIVSNVCLLIALLYLYKLTLLEFGDKETAARTVFYIAAFPTAFFFSAVYTESTFLLFAVATMYYARRQQWGWAGVMGLLTASTRVIGVAMWGVVGLEWLRVHGWTLATMDQQEAWRGVWRGVRKDWPSLLAISLIPLGLLVYMFYLSRQFGDPFAFLTVQTAWGREQVGPLAVLLEDLAKLRQQDILAGEIWWHVPIDWAALIASLAISVAVWRRLGASYALFVILGTVVPAASATQSLSRYALVLFPVFMMLGHWGRRPTLDRALLIGFSVFLGLFTALFVNWIFIA